MSETHNIKHEPVTPQWTVWLQTGAIALVALIGGMIAEDRLPLLSAGLFFISYIAGLWKTLPATVTSVGEGRLDVDFLMVFVAIGAMALGEAAEGAGLLVLFSASRAMEDYATSRRDSAMRALSAELPDGADVLTPNGIEHRPLASIAAGDHLRVADAERPRPGRRSR